MIRIIVPSRTDEYLDLLFRSMEMSVPGGVDRVIVADNGLSTAFKARWESVKYVHVPSNPFIFAQAINMGIRHTKSDEDLLILNDDTEIITPNLIERCELALQSPGYRMYGMLSLSIFGGVGNGQQRWDDPEEWRKESGWLLVRDSTHTLAFVAMLIRRTAWVSIGQLDERYIGYGFDDDDYCKRARELGWRTGILRTAGVLHGRNGMGFSSSFQRYYGPRKVNEMFHENRIRYEEKWRSPSVGA